MYMCIRYDSNFLHRLCICFYVTDACSTDTYTNNHNWYRYSYKHIPITYTTQLTFKRRTSTKLNEF